MLPGSALSAVAFIPARSGSTRVPRKNIARLGDHPALAYSIAAAREAGVFERVVLCTDDGLYAEIGRHYGATVPLLRPKEISGATSPDIDWVVFMLDGLAREEFRPDVFSILRPTNPFRRPETIRQAVTKLASHPQADSLRAVSPVSEHPGKMWVVRGDCMVPLMPLTPDERPWHSQQTSALPQVFKQNASLEVAWSRVARATPPTIAGQVVLPWISEGYDGFDINTPEDLASARSLILDGRAELPRVEAAPFPKRLPTDTADA